MDSRARSENTVRGEKKSRNDQLSSLLFSNRESELVSVKIDFSRISLADQSVRGIEAGKSMDIDFGWRQICNVVEKSRDLRPLPIPPSIKKANRNARRNHSVLSLSFSFSCLYVF